jgi:hypothetical protein
VISLAAGTCKLDWYTTHRPGSGNSLPCNESGTASCLEPCMEGFIKLHNSDLCIQSCPAEHVGPARLCPISRTCIRAGVCPMQVDVPFFCTVPNQFMGEPCHFVSHSGPSRKLPFLANVLSATLQRQQQHCCQANHQATHQEIRQGAWNWFPSLQWLMALRQTTVMHLLLICLLACWLAGC